MAYGFPLSALVSGGPMKYPLGVILIHNIYGVPTARNLIFFTNMSWSTRKIKVRKNGCDLPTCTSTMQKKLIHLLERIDISTFSPTTLYPLKIFSKINVTIIFSPKMSPIGLTPANNDKFIIPFYFQSIGSSSLKMGLYQFLYESFCDMCSYLK